MCVHDDVVVAAHDDMCEYSNVCALCWFDLHHHHRYIKCTIMIRRCQQQQGYISLAHSHTDTHTCDTATSHEKIYIYIIVIVIKCMHTTHVDHPIHSFTHSLSFLVQNHKYKPYISYIVMMHTHIYIYIYIYVQYILNPR